MGSLASLSSPGITLGALGKHKLAALADALRLSPALSSQALAVFDLMAGAWGDWALGDSPIWPNDISDDGTPFELSASFDGKSPKLRMLVENQAEPISRFSSWSAGLAFGKRLERAGLADLSSLEKIQDLFVPHARAESRFTLWHAAVLEEDRPALFKAYLNPCLLGVGSAPYVVEQALRRLGYEAAWDFLERALAAEPSAKLRYFSVDLAAPQDGRVKVYVGCSESASAVDRLLAGGQNNHPKDAHGWLDALTGSQGPFDARPILGCFSFRRALATPDVTVHVPIRCYVKHDAEALARVSTLLSRDDGESLARALSAVSERPLHMGRGLLTYASLRREASVVRVTVYLAPEAYSITSRRPSLPATSDLSSGVHKTSPRRALATSTTMNDVQALIGRHRELLREQPLLRRLRASGTPAQVRQLVGHLSSLLLWLGGLWRLARDRTTDAKIVAQLIERGSEERAQALQFMAELEALGISPGDIPIPLEPGDSFREVAFGGVADVISASDDCVRLGVVLAVFAMCSQVLSAAVEFATRSVTGAERATAADVERSVEDNRSQLSAIAVPENVALDVFAAVERCFESMLKSTMVMDRAIFA